MHVYPVNKIAGANIIGNTLSYSDIRNVYHKYLKHRAYFPTNVNPVIEIKWNEPISADTIIIGDTNCVNALLHINYDNGTEAFEEVIFNKDVFTFIEKETIRKLESIKIDFTARDNEQPYIGYIFTGNKVIIPRFLVEPQWETVIRGTSERTNYGHAFGNILPTLERFAANFMRIPDDEKKTVDDYIQSVQTVIPHIIDPYYEARDKVPPRYATLNKGISPTKRNERDFYWNFDLEWMEAR